MNVDTMRLLVAKGLSAQDLLEVAETMAIRTDRTAAERQARHRAKVAAEREIVTRDITRDGHSDSVTSAPLSAPPNDIYSNPPHHTPQHSVSAREDFPCPVWCEPEVWRDLKRNRRTKKLTNTPTAHKRFIAAVEEMADDIWPPGKLVEAIAAKGWGGAYDPRENCKTGVGNGTDRRGSAASGDGFIRALDRKLAEHANGSGLGQAASEVGTAGHRLALVDQQGGRTS